MISNDLTRNNELAFSSTRNLQFYCFQIEKFFFLDFGFGIPKEKIWTTFYGKAILNQEDRISRSDTARQRVWEWEKMSQSRAIFLCIGFKCYSNGHASWLWLVVFNPYFSVAEKSLPMGRTCTVNFHNSHSLLGQFSKIWFWKDKIKWLVLVCGKK